MAETRPYAPRRTRFPDVRGLDGMPVRWGLSAKMLHSQGSRQRRVTLPDLKR